MNIYFDTEFTGLRKNTTLVSIGLVSDSLDGFYAELSDWDRNYDDEWFNENVKANLLHNSNGFKSNIKDYFSQLRSLKIVYGDKEHVKNELNNWFSKFNTVELISDVCHYDMVLLIDLFGTAFDLPKNVTPACYDINQDISRFFKISNKDAFDMNREELLNILTKINLSNTKFKHNSLYDAFIIRYIYKSLIYSFNHNDTVVKPGCGKTSSFYWNDEIDFTPYNIKNKNS